MELDRIEIGKRIMRRRKESGYTQEKLSEMMGISKNHLSGIERGKFNVTLETIFRLCNTLGRTPDYFLIGQISATTDELTDLIRQLSPKEQRLILRLIKTFVAEKNKGTNC